MCNNVYSTQYIHEQTTMDSFHFAVVGVTAVVWLLQRSCSRRKDELPNESSDKENHDPSSPQALSSEQRDEFIHALRLLSRSVDHLTRAIEASCPVPPQFGVGASAFSLNQPPSATSSTMSSESLLPPPLQPPPSLSPFPALPSFTSNKTRDTNSRALLLGSPLSCAQEALSISGWESLHNFELDGNSINSTTESKTESKTESWSGSGSGDEEDEEEEEGGLGTESEPGSGSGSGSGSSEVQ